MKRSVIFPVLAAAALSLLPFLTGCSKLEARNQLNEGVESYKSAKYDDAIEHFQKAQRLDPTLQMASLYLATAYASQVVPDVETPQNLKNAQYAIDTYQQVLDKNPNDMSALKGVASVYLNTGNTGEAKAWQTKVLAVDTTDPVAYYTIGVIDWRLASKAATAVRMGEGLQDNGDPIKDKAACQQLATENTAPVTEGIDALNKAIALRPSYDDAMSYLSLLYRRKADLDCTDEDARKTDLASFDEWRDKTMATRKVNEAKKNQQTPGGIVIDNTK